MAILKQNVSKIISATVTAEHDLLTKENRAKAVLDKARESYKAKGETVRQQQLNNTADMLAVYHAEYGEKMPLYFVKKADDSRLGGDAHYDGMRAAYIAGFPKAWQRAIGNSKHANYADMRKAVTNFGKWREKKHDAAVRYLAMTNEGLDPRQHKDSESNRQVKNAKAPIDVVTQQANNLLIALQKLEGGDIPKNMNLLTLLDTLRGDLQDHGITLNANALGEPSN